MHIYVNEQLKHVKEDCTIFEVREQFKKDADVIIYNAFPVKEDLPLKALDKVVLIKRGEIPGKDELEALMVSRHTPHVHEKLKKATVGIAGLGGLGSNAAVSLARIGVGKLVIADFDVVEPSNLNRQYYFTRNIGMRKTEALEEIIKDCNPFVEVQAVDVFLDENNIESVFKDVDIIVEAFDNPVCKATIVSTVLSKMKDKKIVAASGMAGYESANSIISQRIKDNFYIIGDLETAATIGRGLMAPRVGVAANHEANTVLRLILGI
jgi:sulfur carrier protein ThiS adenylyltransferase